MPQCKITKLPPSRWQDYKNLRIEAVIDSPQSFTSTVDETHAEPDTAWQSKIKNMFFAVTDDGQLAGMAGCVCDEKEKLAHIGHVVSVYVHPEYRRQGIGRQLLMAIIEYSQGNPSIKKLELGVITTETAAYALYTSVGFKKVGELSMASWANNRFYDEYLMEMVLK